MMSTEYFKAIIDCVGDPIFAKDRHYKLVFVNDAGCEMFGKPREEVLGKTDYELFPKEEADVFRRHDASVFETGEADVNEEQITDAQGNVRTIVTKKTLYVNKAGEKYIVGAIRDITERKRAEDSLLESEVKYRTMVEKSLAGVYIHQDGLFRFVNRRFCEIYGYTYEEIVDKLGALDITPPEDRKLVEENLRKRLSGEADHIEYETRALRKDGKIITVKVLGSFMVYKGRPAVSGTVIDITEQQRAEEQLQQKTALLEAQVSASLDGIIVVDKGKKILQNQQAKDLLKIPGHIAESDDDEAQVAWVKGLAGNPEQFSEKIAYMFAHRGETIRDELELKDGTVLDTYTRPVIGKDGKHYGRIWTFRDITERTRSEEALRASRLQLSEAMDLAHIVYWEVDPVTNTFAFNDPFYAFYGTTAEQEGGYRMTREDYAQRFIHADDRPLFYHFVGQSTPQPGPELVADMEHRIIRRDGAVRHVLTRVRIVKDGSGRIVKRYGAIQDITERKQAEEALRDSEATLRSLINATRETLLLVDPEGKILVANKTIAQRLGRSVRELIGTSMYRDFPPKVAARRKAEFDKVVRTGQPVRFLDERADRTYETYGYPVLDDEGRVAKVAIFAVDITEREQAEEALKKSEVLLRSVVSASPVGIVLETAERMMIWVNDAIVRCSGYSPKELEGRLARIFYASDEEFARVGEILRNEARRGGISVTETEFLRKDGQMVDVQLTAAPVDARDASAGIVFLVANITERKRAEEELQKAHQRLSDIIDFLPDATFVIDREKRVVAWNKAIEEMTGVKKEEILGKGDYAYAVPFYGEPRSVVIDLLFERNEEVEKTYGHVQREGSKLSMEVYVPKAYRGRGAYLSATASPLFDREGNVVGAIESIRDTTEQKRIEKALQESEERYRVAIEGSNDGVALVRGGLHLYVNRKFLEIFGYGSLEEVVGKTHHLTVHPDDLEKIISYNQGRQRGEAVPDRYEFKGLKKNGDIVYIEASVTVTTYQGEPISLVFLRDVTERKSLQAQLLQAQKMEAIGTLAGGVAHDFNNILMALMGYASLLQMKMGKNDPSRVYVDQILASTAKAASITQNLLAFGRKQIMEMKPHKITTIVKDVEKLLQRLMPEDIDLTIRLGDDATVRADMTQIAQVLMNLATNARDAMPKGGRLTIETGRVVIDEEFRRTHGYGKPDAYALILVTDTGMGMEEKTQGKIFEPFFTTKELGKGTGLGLSIVYGIVKQHNGYINVSSRPGEGSTFLLYLPEVKEKPRETRSAVHEAKGGSETLLLAEDNADIRSVMSGILKMSGYTVIDAVNGRNAVEKFREHQDEIKLVILDVVMPEENGKEAYEEIRTMRHDIKALFMSGYTADVVLDKGVFGKALDYIAKPIAPNDLLQKVRNILDR